MEIDDSTNPLIWTAVGYVREQDLVHTVDWHIQTVLADPPWWKFWLMGVGEPRFAGVVLVDTHTLNGQIVKQTRHVYNATANAGLSGESATAKGATL